MEHPTAPNPPAWYQQERGLAVNATQSEQWRPVVGYEGRYEVSDLGRVKSLERTVQHVNRWGMITRCIPERILKPSVHRRGHHRYVLCSDGHKHDVQVHRLVLEAFVGQCPPGMECCHNDGDSSNNRVNNLRWDTRSSNTIDAVQQKTNHHARKTHCPRGHEYDRIEKRPNGRTARSCSRCTRERNRRAKAKRRSMKVKLI
jgi:hypothetical protein